MEMSLHVIIEPYLYAVIIYFFLCRLIPCAIHVVKMSLWTLLSILPALPGCLIGGDTIIGNIAEWVLRAIVAVFLSHLFFKERWKQGLTYTVWFWIVYMLSVCIAHTVIAPDGYDGTAMQRIVLECSVYVPLGAVSVLLIRSINKRRFEVLYLLYLAFPLSLFLMTTHGISEGQDLKWIVGMILGLAAEIALLRYTIYQEKQREVEEELRNVRHMLELERMHYSAVEQRQEELTHIRHDFNNQLSTIRQMLQQGEREDAARMIIDLDHRIESAAEKSYCTIPVVNAVLVEKEREGDRKGVKLRVNLKLRPDIRVEPLHLCSIFSNLLDNAIRGAKASGAEGPEVVLTAMMEGDYLFIKTKNPAREPEKRETGRSGYGILILKNLAAKYEGYYRATFENGTYTAVVSLLAV